MNDEATVFRDGVIGGPHPLVGYVGKGACGDVLPTPLEPKIFEGIGLR